MYCKKLLLFQYIYTYLRTVFPNPEMNIVQQGVRRFFFVSLVETYFTINQSHK